MGEIVMNHMIEERNLSHMFGVIDSCGTASYHVGDAPDSRTLQTCSKHYGKEFMKTQKHYGRQLAKSDFDKFDYILCMDDNNLEDTKERATTQQHLSKIFKCGDFDEQQSSVGQDVPDPYYGGIQGFETVFQQVTRCCSGLIGKIMTPAQK